METLNFAHRGDSFEYPENTMLAFKKALQAGADGIEIDVHKTKDNKLVVIHDEDVQRTFKGKGLIKDYTLEELRKLKCRNEVFRDNVKCRIPTLQEVLTFIKESKLILNIELKTDNIHYKGIEKDVIDLIHEYNLKDKIIISSFNAESLKICNDIDASIVTGLLYSETTEGIIDYAKSIGCSAIHPSIDAVDDNLVVEARDKNMMINVYTINSPNTMRRMLKYNIHGVITNYPDLFEEVKEEK